MSSRNDTRSAKRLAALSSASQAAAHAGGGTSRRRIFPILMLCVFAIALMLALAVGVSVYKAASEAQSRANSQREALGLIVNEVRSRDASGAVATGQGPEGPSLVLVENMGPDSYETRLYAYEGRIVEEYALAASPYAPEKATTVAESGSFSFSYGDGLLTVTCDQGSAEVALRSAQGGGR